MIKNKSDAVIFKNLRNISKLTTTPDGWKVIRIQEGFDLGRGRVINQNEIDTNPGIYPVFSSQTHNNGQMGLINSFDFDGEYLTWTTDGANAGTVFYRIGKFNCTNVCGTLKARHGYCAKFFLYHLNRIAKNYVSYVGNPKLMNDVMGNIVLTSPPYSVQCRIADILGTVDDLIEKTEAAIDKYQAIKTGIMQDLFTRGIDTKTGKLRPTIEEAPELYKESELGWIPKEWDVTDFDDVIKEYFDFRGKTPLKLGMNWGGGSIKAISANNIEPGFINFNKEHYLASEDLYRAWMNHGDCSKGDVVMTSEAPLGVVAQIPDNNKYILSQRVFLFKVKPSSITNDYLYYLMNTDRFQNDLQRQSSGSTVTGIQQARLARIRMQLTRSLEEQLHISKILKSIDLGISDNKEMLSKYKNLKHGLMADLLTGKVRVNLNDNKVEKG